MGILICPVCAGNLEISGNSYVCPNRHSFDIARSGYVNLLLSKHAGKTVHGDNKLMVQARRDFLEKGYYALLCNALCDTVCGFAKNGSIIFDAGCGEGYYTAAVRDKIDQSDIAAEMYGIDVSKIAAEAAAKRKKQIAFAAASVFHIPAADQSCDVLMTLFAPYCGEEYHRILKPGGAMIMAIPGESHLWQLKQAVYDTPYKNEVKPYDLEGFEHTGVQRISYSISLDSQQDIRSLFSMTPYYYKTGRKEQERLAALRSLDTQVEFQLLTYRRI